MKSKMTIDDYGGKCWYNDAGEYHREDGPAVEYADVAKEWWINGKLHREDGPAFEWANGDKEWWINGKLHREDGPAVECANGDKSWFLDDTELTEEEFKERTRKGMELHECTYGLAVINQRGELGHIVGFTHCVSSDTAKGMSPKELFQLTIPLVRFADGDTRGIHHSNIQPFTGKGI